jgi:hypothetical protein
MLFQVKPFEKKFFKNSFSPQISSTPPESSRDGAYIKKEKEKSKALRVSSNKRGSQYFERRKTLQLQKSFFM